MQFDFRGGNGFSGYLAFTGPPTSRRLLVTDHGHDAVHVIDVVARVHSGYVTAPGSLAGPRGVAARGSLVAVTAWKAYYSGAHEVHLFEGSGCSWSPVRVLCGGFGGPGGADGQLQQPYGLRFTSDGSGLAVVDAGNDRVSLFRVGDGSFVRHVATGLSFPLDVEECEGGWLVACYGSHTVEFVGGGGVARAILGRVGDGDGEFTYPTALALVPDLGLVVREEGNDGRVQVFATPDDIAMASMSAWRVGWMVTVVRGIARRWVQAASQAGARSKRRR
jgi:DNA-binding beta-propeller fold protein YncE